MKKWFAFLIVVLMGMLLTSCSSKEIVKVGFVGDLSSKSSTFGKVGRDVLEAYIEDYNASSDELELVLVLKDDQSNKELVPVLLDELIEEGVTFVIGPYISSTAVAASAYFESGELLFISPTVGSDQLKGIDDYFFRMMRSSKSDGIALAQKAIALQKNSPKLAVLQVDHNLEHTDYLVEGFKQIYQSYGEVVYEEIYPAGTVGSYEVFVKSLLSLNPTDILICADSIDVAYIAQYIRLNDSNATLYTGLWANTADLIRFGGTAVEGLYITGAYDSAKNTKEFEDFISNYQINPKDEITFSQATTYEAISVLTSALENCDKKDNETVKAYLLSQRIFNGYNGHLVMDQYGDVIREMILFQVNEGRFELVK